MARVRILYTSGLTVMKWRLGMHGISGGKDTRETARIIKDELGRVDARVASIGQAGKNLVRFASAIAEF
jgi:hypothetical protein